MLLLLGTVSLAPFVASLLLYYFWKPQTFTNYGDLLPVTALSEAVLSSDDGVPFRFDSLRGKWIFLSVDSGTCDEYCQSKLYIMRQIRLTQGKDRDRIERLWLIPDGQRPSPDLTRAYEGTRQLMISAADTFLTMLPATVQPRDHIYLIDPFGNLMMRFPRDADPQQVKKDIARLMKVSSGWVQPAQ